MSHRSTRLPSKIYSLFLFLLLTFCMLGNLACFFVICCCFFFSKSPLSKNPFRNTIKVSTSLKRLSAEDTSRQIVNPIRDNCHLLSHLLMYFHSIYCKQYEPRSDFSSQCNSLIRVASVCFHGYQNCSEK